MEGRYVPVRDYYADRAKVSDGKSVKVTAPEGGVDSQKFYYLGGFLGAAFANADEGQEVALNIELAEYETDQIDEEDDFDLGTPIFWDVDNKRFTETPTEVFAGQVTSAKDDNNVIWFILRPWLVDDEIASVVTAVKVKAEATLNRLLGEPEIEVGGAAADGTRTITVIMKDGAGNDVGHPCVVRVWLSDVAGGGEVATAPTGFDSPASDDVGAVLEEVTENAHLIMLTEVADDESKFNLEVKQTTTNKKVFLNLEWQGAVYTSKEIELNHGA